MTAQEIVDVLAALARPRLTSLLRLQGATRFYEPSPGEIHSKVVCDGQTIVLNQLKRAVQPYRNIERFVAEDRITQFIVDPGLLPLATAMSKGILGRKMLVTRPVAGPSSFPGAAAHVPDFGVRIHMYLDGESQDTILAWECLYGVL